MSQTDDLLDDNRDFAAGFSGSGGSPSPTRRLAVLACMDGRIDPHAILGLEEGDAHVIRNAGGLATADAIRSLALSQHLLGTEEIVLVHHTDCGLQKTTDEEFAVKVEQACGERPPWRALAFTDVEESVRETARRLRESPFLLHRRVRGFVYEVENGRLREVQGASDSH